MSPTLWTMLVPVCLVVSWLLVRRPIRDLLEEMNAERARDQFRMRREGLEARFISSLGQSNPVEKIRWDEAHWRDEVVWARDRKSRHLMAMVGVTFEEIPFGEFAPFSNRHATAIFEYRRGKWHAEGKLLDQTLPNDAFLHNQRFEPVVLPQRWV